MPYKDLEKQREAQREQMKRRRAKQKAQSGNALVSTAAFEPIKQTEGNKIQPEPKVIEAQAAPTQLKLPITEAAEVVEFTRNRLDGIGWCFWTCTRFNNEDIILLRDESITDYPKGYPTYTEDELKQMADMDLSVGEHRRINEIKKLTGAKVANIERS